MRTAHIILVAILFVCLYACSHDASPINQALYTIPEKPQSGKELRIVYNPHHRDAHFPDSEPYFATLTVHTLFDVHIYRIQLDSQDSLFTGTYTVPDSALFIDIQVTPDYVSMQAENIRSMVYRGNTPVRHALPLLLDTASYSDAYTHLDLDTDIYPDCNDRTPTRWELELRHHRDTSAVLREVDSVVQNIFTTQRETGIILTQDMCTLAAGAIYVYSILGKYERAGQLSALLRQAAQKERTLSRKSALRLSSVWIHACRDLSFGTNAQKAIIRPIVEDIVSIAIAQRSPVLLKDICAFEMHPCFDAFPMDEVRGIVHSEQFWPQIKSLSMEMEGDNVIHYGEFLVFLSTEMRKSGDNRACSMLSERILPSIDSAKLWVRGDSTAEVTPVPAPGWEAGVAYDRIHAYLNMHEDSIAIELMRGAARRQRIERYDWLMGRSIVYLAKHFAESGIRDSAELYLSWALQFPLYDAQKLYSYVSARFQNMLTPEDLIRKYRRSDIHQQFRCPHVRIETNRKTHVFGNTHTGNVLLLFSSRTCGICRKVIPELLKNIDCKMLDAPAVILLSDEGISDRQYYAKELTQLTVEYADFDPAIMLQFQQSGVPSYAYIKDTVVVKSGIVGTKSWRSLLANN